MQAILNELQFYSGLILMRKMIRKSTVLSSFALTVFTIAAAVSVTPWQATAAPTAEVAKRCLHYAYIVYPYRPPGAAPASGDREAYFRDCLNKSGEVPEPARPPKKP